MTPSDRLALALCAANTDLNPCHRACEDCRLLATAVAHELAAILRERHGHSDTADWLEAVGSHTPES